MSELEHVAWGSQMGPRPVLRVTGQEETSVKTQGKTLCTNRSSTHHVKLLEKSFPE